MRIAITSIMLLVTTSLLAQDTQVKKTRPSQVVQNPFSESAQAADVESSVGYGSMGMDLDMEEGLGGMGMGMAGGNAPDPEERFGRGLRLAIKMLKQTEDDAQKEVIRGHIRTAFEQRYDRLIAKRKEDVQRLRDSIAQLESDLSRRIAAKTRVVELQLQSVQLAAEGLLELNVPQPEPAGMDDMIGGYGEAEFGGGMSN